MNTVCEVNECAGCMACVDVCPKHAVSVVDDIEHMNAVIDSSLCINCNICHKVCQNNNPPVLREPQKWLQGWGDERTRGTSSSGGFGQALMRAVLRSGWIVAACKLYEGDVRFFLVDDESKLTEFVGSKYVKSNPIGIYQSVKKELKKGKKVLFIGLPCQVSAMRNYVNDDENLYTVDLICHGSPSIKLLQKAMVEYGFDLCNIQAIFFRQSDKFAIETRPCRIVPQGVQDRYTLAFLKGLSYTENCYSCHYAQVERGGDITIGDSWGTEMQSELYRGLSLILCQTAKGKRLLGMVEFNFFDVDRGNSIRMNKQLQTPSAKPEKRKEFFEDIDHGKRFKEAVFRAYPRDCILQDVKAGLIKVGFYQGER